MSTHVTNIKLFFRYAFMVKIERNLYSVTLNRIIITFKHVFLCFKTGYHACLDIFKCHFLRFYFI